MCSSDLTFTSEPSEVTFTLKTEVAAATGAGVAIPAVVTARIERMVAARRRVPYERIVVISWLGAAPGGRIRTARANGSRPVSRPGSTSTVHDVRCGLRFPAATAQRGCVRRTTDHAKSTRVRPSVVSVSRMSKWVDPMSSIFRRER